MHAKHSSACSNCLELIIVAAGDEFESACHRRIKNEVHKLDTLHSLKIDDAYACTKRQRAVTMRSRTMYL
jgi:hypothetical protein